MHVSRASWIIVATRLSPWARQKAMAPQRREPGTEPQLQTVAASLCQLYWSQRAVRQQEGRQPQRCLPYPGEHVWEILALALKRQVLETEEVKKLNNKKRGRRRSRRRRRRRVKSASKTAQRRHKPLTIVLWVSSPWVRSAFLWVWSGENNAELCKTERTGCDKEEPNAIVCQFVSVPWKVSECCWKGNEHPQQRVKKKKKERKKAKRPSCIHLSPTVAPARLEATFPRSSTTYLSCCTHAEPRAPLKHKKANRRKLLRTVPCRGTNLAARYTQGINSFHRPGDL